MVMRLHVQPARDHSPLSRDPHTSCTHTNNLTQTVDVAHKKPGLLATVLHEQVQLWRVKEKKVGSGGEVSYFCTPQSPRILFIVCVWLGLAAAVVCNNARAKVIVGPAGTKSAEKPGLTGGAAEPFIGRRMRVTIMTNSLIALKENIHVRLMID